MAGLLDHADLTVPVWAAPGKSLEGFLELRMSVIL